jgi:hypothetical protein
MRKGRTAAATVVAAIGIAALASPAPLASAATVRNATAVPASIKLANFAGYSVPTGPHAGKATFKVPKVTCKSVNSGTSPGVFFVGPGLWTAG